MKNLSLLRRLIEELLNEPDDKDDDPQEEISGAVPGVVTPLGTGPDGGKGSYKKNKKNSNPRIRAVDANKRAFGGGELYYKK